MKNSINMSHEVVGNDSLKRIWDDTIQTDHVIMARPNKTKIR